MSNEQEKRDNENYAKNFTRTCNIVLESYKHLTHEEKFLYIKLKCVYWDAKPRFATLREISHLTGYAISALSRILPRLHKCGLVHAEIKQEYNPDGTKKGKPKYYITIPDIWELNRRYFECSPEERFDPSDVLLKNNNVPLKNNNVLQKNENVLQKNDVVPPEEHFRGAKTNSRAGSQLPKDSKDIYKDSKKEREADTTPTGTPSSLPSSSFSQQSDLSTSIVDNCLPDVDKPSARRDTEPLTRKPHPEAIRIFGLLCDVFYAMPPEVITPKIESQCTALAPHVRHAEDLKSLRDYARAEIMDDPSYKKKQVHLGNLVKAVNGWKQKQTPILVAVGAQQPKPKTKKQAEEEWLASLTADPWK